MEAATAQTLETKLKYETLGLDRSCLDILSSTLFTVTLQRRRASYSTANVMITAAVWAWAFLHSKP